MGKKKVAAEPAVQEMVYYDPERLPPRPDRSAHDRLRKAYRLLQLKHGDLLADRAALENELRMAELKQKRLQSECDLIVDQLLAAQMPDGQIPEFDFDLLSDDGDTDDTVVDGAADLMENGTSTTTRPKRPRDDVNDSPSALEKRPRLE